MDMCDLFPFESNLHACLPLSQYPLHCGFVVSVLASRGSSPGLNRGQGHCVVFLARHFTLTVHLSTQMYNDYGEFNLFPVKKPLITL